MAEEQLSSLGSVIKTAYEGEADTNEFSDAEQTKLGGVEALADVTDETNVIASLDGATIPAVTVSGTDKVILQDVDDADNLGTVTAQSIANLAPGGAPEGTSVLSTGEVGGTKFLREDGDNSCSWQTVPVGTGDLKADGTVPLTANWDVGAFTLTGTQFISDIATGTAPLVVASTTEVANLNAATAGNADTVTTNANLTGIVTSTGNATAIADKAIAIAKLADGTDGELITWDATGVIAAVAAGTATQVLTSNGAGAAPTFQAAGGGAVEGTAVLSTGETGGTKFLREDGDNSSSWQTVSGGFTSFVDDEVNQDYAIGQNALDSITSGGSRIAIGKDALTSATSEQNNFAVGNYALSTCNFGGPNTAIGHYSLNKLNNGDKNTAVGYHAGEQNIGSHSTTAVGHYAGQGTGADWVAVGDQAMGSSGTTHIRSVAIGSNSLAGSTGVDNVAVGYHTLLQTGTQAQSVAIGSESGVAATGSGQVLFGFQSGNSITTGGYNIVIGHDSDVASATVDDQISIGHGAAVPAIDGSLGARTDVDYSAKSLTITGSSALAGASTNLDAGDLVIQGGTAATTGIGIGGDLYLRGGTEGATGTTGLVMMDNLPTSDPSVAGALWANSSVLTVSAG